MSLIDFSPENQYAAFAKTSTIAGAASTHLLLRKAWKLITKREPPVNPASPEVLWKEALIWGATTGLVAGVMKIMVHRLSAEMWKKYKGTPPKGL